MKLIETRPSEKRIFSGVLILMVLLAGSCSTRAPFLTSSIVPAAEGSVKIKKDNNNNYKIDLNVMRLADPSRLNPPKMMYVVWMETAQGGPKNIGQLKTSSGFLSKTLTSSLETVTSSKPTGFFITAEDDETAQYPGIVKVLTTGGL